MPAQIVAPSSRLSLLLTAAAWLSIALASLAAVDRWRPVQGLRATTYAGPDWAGRPLEAAIDATLSSEFLASAPRRDLLAYSVEWTGALVVESPGLYTFKLSSDDGSTLDLDGQNCVDNDGVHGPRIITGQRELSEGVHAIRLKYFQAGDRQSLGLRWARDGVTFTPIPEHALLPAVSSYRAYRWRWLPPVAGGILTGLSGVALLVWVRATRRRMLAGPAVEKIEMALRLLERPAVACAVILAVGVPLRFALWSSSPAVLWPDSHVFYTTVREILAGEWRSHDAYRTLLYPYFLTAFFARLRTPDTGALVIAAQQVMGLAASLLFYWVGRRAFSPLVALAGAVLFAAHSLQLFYEMSVMSETLFTITLAICAWATVRACDSPTVARGTALGLAAAALVLVRPVAQWYVVCLLLVTVVAAKGRPRLASTGALVLCYSVPILAWMGVNQHEYGFFGVALGRGMGLYTRVFQTDRMEPPEPSRYPDMRGLWWFAESQQWHANRVRDELNYARHHTAAAADDAMYQFALETVRLHPVAFAAGTVRQWATQIAAPRNSVRECPSIVGPYLCSARTEGESLPPFPNLPDQPSRLRERMVRYVTSAAVPMSIIAVFATFGLAACLPMLRANPAGLLCAATIGYLTLVPALSLYPEDRFRLPVDAFLFMFAAWGLRALAIRWPIARDRAGA